MKGIKAKLRFASGVGVSLITLSRLIAATPDNPCIPAWSDWKVKKNPKIELKLPNDSNGVCYDPGKNFTVIFDVITKLAPGIKYKTDSKCGEKPVEAPFLIETVDYTWRNLNGSEKGTSLPVSIPITVTPSQGLAFSVLVEAIGKTKNPSRSYRARISVNVYAFPTKVTPGDPFFAQCPDKTKPDPNWDPASLGFSCSSPFGDNPAGYPDTNFLGPCTGHDICYRTCNSVKASCDSNFLQEMEAVCNAAAPAHQADCMWWANVYYDAVSVFGGGAHFEGQTRACFCCVNRTL